MKKKLLAQYEAIRVTIKNNIETIGNLIEQANKLKELIEGISNETIKDSLEKEVIAIENTIKKLIEQTDNLFDKYNEFAKTIFE